VEGTVLRANDRVRITAQLIDAARETHLWAESYERTLRDVLALQAELAQAIAHQIQVKLTPQERAIIAQVHPVHPEAYEAYLQGRYYWNRRSREGLGKAVKYFQQAVAKDSTNALAQAGLADCYTLLGQWGLVAPEEGCGKAKQLAVQALEIDRSLAEAHTSLAWATTWYDYDFSTAEKEFERSLELNPRYATAHSWFGFYLAMMGRYEEGYTEVKRAIRLDPLSTLIHFVMGCVYWSARRYDQAIEQCKKAIDLEPDNAFAHAVLGLAYVCKSLYEPAIAAVHKGVQRSQGASAFVAALGMIYAAAGYRDEALKALEQLQELAKQAYVMPYLVARIYTALGDKDEAFRCLEASYRGHDGWMVCLKVDPHIDTLRSDPRFHDLLRRMNFPP
jgi:tetratricopeptide (TPR) repeat protein